MKKYIAAGGSFGEINGKALEGEAESESQVPKHSVISFPSPVSKPPR